MCLNLPELERALETEFNHAAINMHGNEFSVKPLDNKAWIDNTLRLVTHHVR